MQWHIENMQKTEMRQVVKDFLSHIYGAEEFKKIAVLDAVRDRSRNQIKEMAKLKLPSLFSVRAAWPLALPKEAPSAKFDIEFIYRLKHRVDELKQKETAMEEQSNVPQENNETKTAGKAPRFHLPTGVTPEQLTTENFRTLTGRRFRVTTEQQNRIAAGTLTRDGAFAEFIEELKKESK